MPEQQEDFSHFCRLTSGTIDKAMTESLPNKEGVLFARKNHAINAESAMFAFNMTKEPVARLCTTLASSEPGVFLVSYSLERAPLVLLLD